LNIEDVIGTDFGDRISGSSSANRLVGNAGDDWLRGEAGNDTLVGGAGNDLLAGGAGADTFQIAAVGGQDRVLDFSRTDGDTIAILNHLNCTGIASATDLLSRISASGNDSVVDLGNGHTLTVVGIGAGTWLVTDFQVV
jgi:Ca2+-binding RTX toxin-like protein